MDFDVGSRAKKLAKEQEARREAARKKLQKEREWKEQAEKLRVEMELESQRRKAEQLQRELEEEERRLEDERVTGGIAYKQTLRAVAIDNDGDKITLPVSALEALNPQNALDMGVLSFELTHLSATTHASVLEFVADEGTIGIPPKIAKSLDLLTHDSVHIGVRFVRLARGRFVQLQPLGDGFGDRQLDLKALLERTLQNHTTITQGDILLVRQGGVTFDIAVRQVLPEPQVQILNVDLEVDVLPSEAVDAARRAAEEAALATARAEAHQKAKAERLQAIQADAAGRVPDEPPTEMPRIKIVVRLPSGSPATRFFAPNAALQGIFDMVIAATGLEHFQLVANYPRRVFTRLQASESLASVGLSGRQEALFIEATTPPSDIVADTLVEDVDMRTVDGPTEMAATWRAALDRWAAAQDAALHAPTDTVHGLEPVASPGEGPHLWDTQLAELAAMGFTNTALNIQILEKYQGRLLRVVNYLSELHD
ncbi:hypothetical protein SPRG_02756 [Saprolegnia parasitica CBS 223.65]|uniref:UBX domain-containing protein n=1 Tax=Saprolegnia parasitica (strain CBS 223.65) TaxID=695850 RepID=A0A067CZR0_SAPPC|nr:hypothetical protein SPRG_02756 [Saprolegnia parasitica CBS 223.65]KDO32277.1 hypothetical protein SPRG_02756 [Saprolegnia parasitica CBS 223.65]|eukprot:XP_012196733.1 hypothetical protein SPRG_02756 [Saprolegnia parasitica CBS 223.65]